MSAAETIAWIGVGNLATPIVRRLLDAGRSLTLVDLSPERLTPFAGRAAVAADAAAAAQAAHTIFTTLPSDGALEAVARALAPALTPDHVVCDMSTVSPEASARAAETLAPSGAAYVRAPVSGSVAHAEKGILTALTSGPDGAVERLAPIFEHFCAARVHIGSAEEARYLKLLINNMVGSTAAMMAESLALARKAGLDWEKTLSALENSAVASPLVKYKAGPLRARDFSPAFTTALMIKDMTLFADAAAAAGVPTPIAERTLALLREAAAEGFEQDDFFSTVRVLERRAGVEDA